MNIHKRARLTRIDREKLWSMYSSKNYTVVQLSEYFRVSRPTIYTQLKRCRLKEFVPRNSTNNRYRCLRYGLKRLAKIEHSLEEKKKLEAKRYNKRYSGELVHFDTKRLPLLKGEDKQGPREHLFIAIDDFSRELFAAIMPDKSQVSSAAFLEQVIDECPYTIEYTYSDNGKEYKGTPNHSFVKLCTQNGIGQLFTRIKRPQTNGKAERVIRTMMESWHQTLFTSRKHRKQELIRWINYYNTVKPHKGIDNITPHEKLNEYFFNSNV